MWFLFRYLWILFVYCVFSWIYITLVKIKYNFDYFSDKYFSEYEEEGQLYDYVVVGAGSAGCVVAARLAEDPSVSVLLIEAGGPPSSLYDIPLAAPMLQLTPYDWQYKTEPQRNACLAMNQQRSLWPRGKILGGTSRLNYLVYMRGHPADYDSWLSDDGQHWTWQEIQDFFRKSEDQLGIYASDGEHHSTGGPYAVSDLAYTSGLVEGLLGAARELGLGVGDINGAGGGKGFMQTQATTRHGARHSAEHILAGRRNVRVLLYTHVTQVLLRRGFEAYGVHCERHGQLFTARARREVILSAGTIGSAHILLLSGIGPAAHLAQHNISVAVDLPVGEGLQDHVATGLDLVVTNQSSPLSWRTAVNPLNPLEYLLYGQGPLTHPGCEVVGVVQTGADPRPDLQFMALPGGLSSDAGVVLKNAMGISDKLFRDYFAPLVGTPVATLLPTVLHPRSRGYVRLRSPDYRVHPVIDPQYLTNPDDVEVLVRGVQLLTRLAETRAMARVGGYVYDRPLPPCVHLAFRSPAYWECYVRHLTVTAYHMAGTCRMGPARDNASVVDHSLRVLGTSRLRVVDASIMPSLPSGNTNAAVVMIAEKAADMLKTSWRQRRACCHLRDVFLAPA